MRYPILIILATILLVLTGSLPAMADRGHGGHGGHSGVRTQIWLGPVWEPFWPRTYVYPYPYAYPYPYPYYDDPVVVEEQPVYLQPAPRSAAPKNDQSYYWYYCKNPAGYYPYVQACPSGWTRVAPTPPDTKESK